MFSCPRFFEGAWRDSSKVLTVLKVGRMKTELCSSQLYHACHVLFGWGIDVSADFLRYLQMTGLKAAYRERALETHPDRAVALSRPPTDLEERFKEVNAAYRELHDYLENPWRFTLTDNPSWERAYQPSERMRTRTGTQTKQTGASPEKVQRHVFTGTLPKRVLLFGQFVYYSGYISYVQLIDAILWQKIRRPMVGHIALHRGWLHEDHIREILRHRNWGEKFGEVALRGGYLTPDELRKILVRQRLLQPRIGGYFVEKRLFTVSCVEKMAERLRRHNREFNRR
ncbi:MAG: hypothetical protein D4R93_03030 [Deltaproteobacteria bacterium]|nr:MAG: hypothetical protein D4R93_03030 [Deltaproteobacteria bacterium]